jgi:Mg-chelatase subunit ChlD
MLNTIVIDRSSSMNAKIKGTKKIELVKNSLNKYFVSQQGSNYNDQVAVVIFPGKNSTTAEVLYPPFYLGIKPYTDRLMRLTANGSSPIGEGLLLALNLTINSQIKPQLITLISDAQENIGIHPREIIPRILQKGIFVEVICIAEQQERRCNKILDSITQVVSSQCLTIEDSDEIINSLKNHPTLSSKTIQNQYS